MKRPLPQQAGRVVAQLEDGRADGEVVERPTAQNGYTTVIRVTDPAGGADNYRVVAYWQNYANGDYIGKGSRARGRDRDRDDVYDRNGYPNRNRNGGVYGNGATNNNHNNSQALP